VQVKAQLFALPLAPWERGGLKAALLRAGLPTDDVDATEVLFWRFERNDMPVGFGGLEVHGDQALLRSLVTLPPVRNRGIGSAMVEVLETEAAARNLRAIYLLATSCVHFFARLGYAPCSRDAVPATILASVQFASLCPPTAMTKSLERGVRAGPPQT
jgi:N-acetylglutamate synthase-like GNAT family acetyltransferase